MSSSELSEDEYNFDDYKSLDNLEENNFPPLIKKRSRILLAAVHNDVQTLKNLLDSPKWYQVRDKNGRNLLLITIISNSKEAFDFLLCLDDFPLETSVVRCIDAMMDSDTDDEYYLFEMIKRGIDVDRNVSEKGNSLLHCAIKREYITFVRFLINGRGVDLDAQNLQGQTPLHLCCSIFNSRNQSELISMLLCCGADPFICDNEGKSPFEAFVTTNRIWESEDIATILLNLAYFTHDHWSKCQIPASILLRLTRSEWSVFESIIPLLSEKTIKKDVQCFHAPCIFSMETECLELLLEKLPFLVRLPLQKHAELSNLPYNIGFSSLFQNENCKLENFDIISKTLPSVLIDFVSKINSTNVINNLIRYSRKPTKEIVETILHLLSYGMTLREIDFEMIYKKLTGYNGDFKILLQIDDRKQFNKVLLPRLICDLTLDVDGIVEDSTLCNRMDWNLLFEYFAHPKLQQAFQRIKGHKFNEELPQVPSLQELARDAFRKHFVKTFQIQSATQFFALIRKLPISPVHKKIITYETKLYHRSSSSMFDGENLHRRLRMLHHFRRAMMMIMEHRQHLIMLRMQHQRWMIMLEVEHQDVMGMVLTFNMELES